ncbi:MBL fold metallo-hydrolase [Aquitalea sp.]|uniref:MBL fold metallo-hydrolase n=1 Tax=Aquitalea sp. TaxID=1872623 RepID=UPI0025907531|nr:MBL fold metallo-hydrolase [Aquitalea sp.]
MATITFYPVGTGDTSQIVLDDGRRILMDFRHLTAGEDEGTKVIDLAARLNEELKEAGRDYFDVVIFTHADLDHIRNSHEFFELPGAGPQTYTGNGRIKVHEFWVPAAMLFEEVKQKQRGNDYEVLRRELRQRFRDGKGIKVFSRPQALLDWMEKDGLSYEDREHLFEYAGRVVNCFQLDRDGIEFFTHSPFSDSESTAQNVYRNEDSLIFQIRFASEEPINLMAFGDSIYDAIDDIVLLSKRNGNTDRLKWDLLSIPHHCSYECLNQTKEDPERDGDRITLPTAHIRELLKVHAAPNPHLVSSSNPIREDEEAHNRTLPPHIQAKRGYRETVGLHAPFWVTMEHPSIDEPQPLVFEVGQYGLSKLPAAKKSTASHHGISAAQEAAVYANPRSGASDE